MPKKISGVEKAKIVLTSLGEGVVITQYCRERHIPRSTYYRWRHLFLAGCSAFLSGKRRSLGGKKAAKGKIKKYKCRIR